MVFWRQLPRVGAKRDFKHLSILVLLLVFLKILNHTKAIMYIYCYKNFTAVPTDTPLSIDISNNVRSRSNVGESANQSTSGIFPKDCLFCKKKKLSKGKLRVEMPGSCETLEADESVRRAAEILHDDEMLNKIAGVDFVTKEVKYHNSCKSKYLKSAERAKMAPCNVVLEKTCVDEICSYYVERSIINDGRSELLSSIWQIYQHMWRCQWNSSFYQSKSVPHPSEEIWWQIKTPVSKGEETRGCRLQSTTCRRCRASRI